MNNPIHLVDNIQDGINITGETTIQDILHLANIGQLQNAPNLLVFPGSFSENKDGIQDLSILTTHNHKLDNNGKCISLDVCTGNLMGFVGVNETSVSIHSRFTHKKQNGLITDYEEDYFLYYMLQKVFSINVFSLEHSLSREDKVLDFLMFLFPSMLKKALSQGLYKEYQTFHYNDSHVKGTINVNEFIHRDIPFNGSISYTTRQYSYDNAMTQLIRHTIEYINHHPLASSILRNDSKVQEYVNQIIQATPSYNLHERTTILNANLKPKVHPYFLRYKDLQQLCISILRHDSLKYGKEKNKIFGILFDGAWLWEEYLYTILKEKHFNHPRNKESKGGIRMFVKPSDEDTFTNNGRKIYPDFYRKDYILDAKYKHLKGMVGREDLYQVVAYMHCMDAPTGGYIYPDEGNNPLKEYMLSGSTGGKLKVIPFYVPQNALDWGSFIEQIESSEKKLLELI